MGAVVCWAYRTYGTNRTDKTYRPYGFIVAVVCWIAEACIFDRQIW